MTTRPSSISRPLSTSRSSTWLGWRRPPSAPPARARRRRDRGRAGGAPKPLPQSVVLEAKKLYTEQQGGPPPTDREALEVLRANLPTPPLPKAIVDAARSLYAARVGGAPPDDNVAIELLRATLPGHAPVRLQPPSLGEASKSEKPRRGSGDASAPPFAPEQRLGLAKLQPPSLSLRAGGARTAPAKPAPAVQSRAAAQGAATFLNKFGSQHFAIDAAAPTMPPAGSMQDFSKVLDFTAPGGGAAEQLTIAKATANGANGAGAGGAAGVAAVEAPTEWAGAEKRAVALPSEVKLALASDFAVHHPAHIGEPTEAELVSFAQTVVRQNEVRTTQQDLSEKTEDRKTKGRGKSRGSWRENKRGTSTAKIVPLAPDVVVTKLVAEGSVGDYDGYRKTQIAEAFAAPLDGVVASDVTVVVEPYNSVVITVTIKTTDAKKVAAGLRRVVADAGAATALLAAAAVTVKTVEPPAIVSGKKASQPKLVMQDLFETTADAAKPSTETEKQTFVKDRRLGARREAV